MKTRVEKIQDYIDDLLEGDELISFEQELATDKALETEVRAHRHVQAALQRRLDTDADMLRESITSAGQKWKERPNNKSKLIFKIGIPILTAACILVFFKFFFVDTDQLYDVPKMDSEIVRGATEVGKYEDAVVLFNGKSYTKARLILADLLQEDSTNTQYAYYIGLSYYAEENWAESIAKLQPIAAGQTVFARDATYYLAASYVKNKQKDRAIVLLEEIKGDDELGIRASKLRKNIE